MRNTITKRENRKKEEKQKKKGDYYSEGMGLNEDTTQSTLNNGTRNNIRRKKGNDLTVQGGKKNRVQTMQEDRPFYQVQEMSVS
jgi:hypothetical protein